MASWDDAPQLAPLGDYKLECVDYLVAGSQGGAATVDIMIIGFADPKDADKYVPFRIFLNDQRDRPEQLDEDTWSAIQERNADLKEMILEAFGFKDGDEYYKLIGKNTGKNKLRVSQRDQGGTTQNTISLPRNPAPQGDYSLEILAADYRERPGELGMRQWLTLTIGINGQDEEGKSFTPVRGTDTMVKFCWTKEFMQRDEELKKGFKSERDYMQLVQQDAERAQRICQAFGLPKPEQAEDADTLYLQWNSDLRSLLTKGMKTRKTLRLTQTLDQSTGERYNRIHWPALVR